VGVHGPNRPYVRIEEVGVEQTLASYLRNPDRSVTEAEIANALTNSSFFKRTTFYLNGETITVDRAKVLELAKKGP